MKPDLEPLNNYSVDLVPIERDHLKLFMLWRNDPRNAMHLRHGHQLITPENQEIWWDHIQEFNGKNLFSIKDHGVLIGYCGLLHTNPINREVEFSLLVQADQALTLQVEAGKQLIDRGFKILGLHRITAIVYSNAHERGVLAANLGFKYEGQKRQARWWDGWHDELIYGLLNTEWPIK